MKLEMYTDIKERKCITQEPSVRPSHFICIEHKSESTEYISMKFDKHTYISLRESA